MMRLRNQTAAIFIALLMIAGASRAKNTVHVIEIDEAITPATVSYIEDAIETAREEGSEALVIKLDTPGGLVTSTKDIVKLFYGSDLPVVVYVAPAGASATSAGLMITIAGHVAVMAPGTNIGASHPVMISQQGDYKTIPKDDVMMEKATNDTVSWVKSICDVRGRNSELAELAVTESKSYTAIEAAEKKLVEAVIKDMGEMVEEFLPGVTVTMNSGDTVKMDTRGADIVEINRSVSQTVHKLINDPTVIAILILLGGLGIAIEFKAPGLLFPALIGVGLIIIALLAPSIPINYMGLLLLVIGIALLVAEAFVTSYGALSVAGVAGLVTGLVIMFDAEEVPDMDPFLIPDLRPSWPFIITFTLFCAALLLLAGRAIVSTHRQKVMTGKEELVGEEAVAEADIGPDGGKIFVHGEYWNAESDSPIAKGEKVVIKSVSKLLCKVEKAEGGPPPGNER
jgi:membrane-bound serine protease (ClpP class)